jgi:UrcA family protein
MNTKTHNATKLMIAAALCAAFAAGANAGDVTPVHVKYADLDMNDAAGAKVLYQRIHKAADLVCAVPDENQLAFRALKRNCMEKTIAEAVAGVNAPTLTALYEAKLGKMPAKVALNR